MYIPTAMLICSDAASLDTIHALRKLRPELILLSLADGSLSFRFISLFRDLSCFNL